MAKLQALPRRCVGMPSNHNCRCEGLSRILLTEKSRTARSASHRGVTASRCFSRSIRLASTALRRSASCSRALAIICSHSCRCVSSSTLFFGGRCCGRVRERNLSIVLTPLTPRAACGGAEGPALPCPGTSVTCGTGPWCGDVGIGKGWGWAGGACRLGVEAPLAGEDWSIDPRAECTPLVWIAMAAGMLGLPSTTSLSVADCGGGGLPASGAGVASRETFSNCPLGSPSSSSSSLSSLDGLRSIERKRGEVMNSGVADRCGLGDSASACNER